MKYRLGLDLGVGSIGSSIIELDEQNNPKNIVDAGVRIFDVSDGAEERRLSRTMRKNKRRARKRLELLAQKLFANNLWVNDTPEGTAKLNAKSPYKIRFDAICGMLANPNYVGRAILHIAKHRGAGFVSATEEMQEEILDEGEKSKAKKTAYDMMLQHLKETNSRTLGEFFYKRICESYEVDEAGNKNNSNKRLIRQKEYALSQHIVDYAIPRYLVKDEFNQIWDEQAKYFKQMQKPGLKKEIYDILFYECSAAPYAIGKCIYFHDEDRLLKAHPLSELRRIYEEVNNIRVLSDVTKRKLTLEERNKVIDELLLQGKNAGKQSIKKILNLSPKQKISLVDDKNIKAYLYSCAEFSENVYLQSLSDEKLCDFIDFLANPINPNDRNGRLYNEDDLISHLKPILKIDDDKEIGKLLTKLPKGRGMLGKTASQIILKKLKESVTTHREITDELSKTDVRFTASEEVARQNQGKSDALPYYGEILQSDTQPLPPLMIKNNNSLNPEEIKWGKIANPAVHMILNQIRLVVNDIIRIYGKPYDINIELSRDIGLSTQKKQREEQNQKNNEKLNEEAKKYLKDHHLFINRKNILKYKLAKEQGWKDAYNPLIAITRNFSGFEIEHIIPQSKGGTDTYNNLCLVNRNDNLNKENEFAYDYFIGKGQKSPELIGQILKNARERTPNKAWRFEADAREKFEDQGDQEETTRYLTDTRYVSKMAVRYLKAIVDYSDSDEVMQNRILAIKGTQTAQMRRCWNLQGIEYELMGLDVPRFVDCSPYWVEIHTGEVVEGTVKPDIDGNWKLIDKEKNKQWLPKARIDHRHHALDAIVIACITRSMIQKMANEQNLRTYKVPLPLLTMESIGEFRQKVIDVLKNIHVSHKAEHGKAGKLHKETGKTVLCVNPDNNKSLITVYSRKILQVLKNKSDLKKFLIPDTIKNEWNENIAIDKAKQEKLVNDFEIYMNKAQQILVAENEQNVLEGKREVAVTESRILIRAFRLIQADGLWKGDKFRNYENSSSLIYIRKHGVAYEGRNNYRVDFYLLNGKIGWEVIRCFDINQKDFIPQWQQQGGKIIWSIQQGDTMELDTPTQWQKYTDKIRCFAKVKKFCEGRMTIDYISDARMTSPKDKALKYMVVDSLEDKGLSFFVKHHARKIELTPFGKMKKKHKVLFGGTTKKA